MTRWRVNEATCGEKTAADNMEKNVYGYKEACNVYASCEDYADDGDNYEDPCTVVSSGVTVIRNSNVS
ncbi:Hypp43 [Branchiostoma lanceolatum]|uniref:Hypp43 protein n=1 Tax=Branchiostoma lanceolatum TaxID=7740 RepID=A0A8J9WBB6_BRALA|nr:Hypp43 [Branchiostoma lanceolatum]